MSGTASRAVSISTGVTLFSVRMRRASSNPSHLGHHHVKDDHIEVVIADHLQSFAAIHRARDRVPFFTQTLAQQLQHSPFIFDNQQFHGKTSRFPLSKNTEALG